MTKLATIALVLFVSAHADAKPKAKGKGNLKVHMERAAKAHKDGKFEVALEELQAAYKIDPQPKLVYAIAQVYAKLDNCKEAIEHYEKFIAKTKEKDKQAVAREAIEACKTKQEAFANRKPEKPEKQESSVFRDRKPAESELPTSEEPKTVEAATESKPVETKPEPVEPKPAPVVEPKPEPKPAPPPPPRNDPPRTVTTHSPWYYDVIGDALVIGGVGALVGAYFTYSTAQSDLDKAEAAPTLPQYESFVDSAETNRLYTVVLAGAGITLVGAGVLRYQLRDKHETRVAIVPTHDGGFVTWSGGF